MNGSISKWKSFVYIAIFTKLAVFLISILSRYQAKQINASNKFVTNTSSFSERQNTERSHQLKIVSTDKAETWRRFNTTDRGSTILTN